MNEEWDKGWDKGSHALRNKNGNTKCHATESEHILFEYDIEIQAELGIFKGSESKFNSFDSVFRIDSAKEFIRIANRPALSANKFGSTQL